MKPEIEDEIEAFARDNPEQVQAIVNVMAGVVPPKRPKESQANIIVEIALELFRFTRSSENEPVAVALDRPSHAVLIRGDGLLKPVLAREYWKRMRRVAPASALGDAVATLEGLAMEASPEPLALRIATRDDEIFIDLADGSNRAVAVSGEAGWKVMQPDRLLFKTTPLQAPLPEPVTGGSLDDLRDLLNVSETSWPLLAGFMIGACVPDIPKPLVMLSGIQGSGKSLAAQMIVQLIDPTPAPLRSPPRSPEDWAVVASSSHVIALDNISWLSVEMQDALCRAATGDAWVARRRFTDSGLSILVFKRAVIATTIDPGMIKGDLADRILCIDLLGIDRSQRRSERELLASYFDARPKIFGGMLDVLSDTMRALPGVEIEDAPRLIDFARVLKAMDNARPDVTGGNAFALFCGQRSRLAQDVVQGDSVGLAIVALMSETEHFEGTPTELMLRLTPMTNRAADWPKLPHALTGRLKRLQPALGELGITVEVSRDANARRVVIARAAT